MEEPCMDLCALAFAARYIGSLPCEGQACADDVCVCHRESGMVTSVTVQVFHLSGKPNWAEEFPSSPRL